MKMKNKKKRIKFFIFSTLVTSFIFFVPFFVSSCSLPDDLQQEQVINRFFPNLWVFLAHVIAVVVLFIILYLLTWRPVKKTLDSRNKYIRDQIESARTIKQKAIIIHQKSLESLIKAYKDVDTIVLQAQMTAQQEKDKIITEAKKAANRISENAILEVKRQELKSQENLNNEVSKMVFEIVEELLNRNISSLDNKKLVNSFIKKLSEE